MHNALNGDFANITVRIMTCIKQILERQKRKAYKQLEYFCAGTERNATATCTTNIASVVLTVISPN